MEARFIDVLTRRTALTTLGTSGLAALVGLTSLSVAAAKSKNKRKKKNKGNAKQQCKKQVAQCVTFLELICEENDDCNDPACCSFLGKCNATGFMECIVEDQQLPA